MAPMILIRNLHKSFGDNEVLRGVNLTVEEGTTVVILGSSGSGKSVLLKHMIGLLRPDSGSICVDGEDVTSLSPGELNRFRRKFGMVFQASALFDSMTVEDNVAFPLREHREGRSDEEIHRIVAAKLKLVGLERAAKLDPAELSGGMRKRVALARAVARDPKIVLYDEPTTGLDPITTDSVNDMIEDARRKLGVTSVVISHDIGSALRIADQVAVLYEGRIVESSTPEQLRHTTHPHVRAFLQTWFQRS